MSDTAALIQGNDRWLLAFQTAAKADPCFGAARFCRGARKASMLPARRLACSRTGATCVGDRKGVGLMFPRWPWILCGNTRALGDACGSSGKPHAAREPHLGCFHCTYGFGRASLRTASRVPGMQGRRHSKCLSAKITAPTSHEHFLVRVGSSGGVDHKVPFIMVCSSGGVAYQFPLMSAGPCSHA